jgi:hypothetical protein
MHRVTMSFIDMQGMITVTFIESGKKVGRQYRYTVDRRLFDILRTCACPIEDHNLVERCLVERRPGSVQLKLTDAQHQKLIGAWR